MLIARASVLPYSMLSKTAKKESLIYMEQLSTPLDLHWLIVTIYILLCPAYAGRLLVSFSAVFFIFFPTICAIKFWGEIVPVEKIRLATVVA